MEQDAASASRSPDDTSSSGLRVDGFTGFLGRAPAAAADPIGPGTRIGDVTIVRLVGEGGMGRVYEALQGLPCRTVAVKVVRPGVLSHAAAKRFEHEVHILGRLTHSGICRIYSVGLHHGPDGDVPFFVMEFVDDALSITAYAKRRNLSVRERVQLFREVCGAVAHGHQKGVIHRDLKPGNILVDPAGRPKIIDFGVARSTDADVAITTMHTDVRELVGTLIYMAPEQFDGQSDDLDVRADVYALGLVLYELLAGGLPYDVRHQAVHEVAHIVRNVDPRSLSSIDPRLRGDLDTIVSTCLQKERGRRYSSAAEVEADLGRYLCGEPIAARRPSLADALIRLARRHRIAAVATAGVVATVIVAMAGIAIFAVRAEQQRELAVEAERMAMREARIAAEQRDAADRERARADKEAALARERLYVANLRAMQSSLNARNIRMARSLHDDNVALVGGSLPIEMRCLAVGLDDSVLVLEPEAGPISQIEYGPDAATLMVFNAAPISSLRMPRPLPLGVDFGAWTLPQVFAVRDDGGYERLDRMERSTLGRADAHDIPMRGARKRDEKEVNINLVDDSGTLAKSGDGRRLASCAPGGGIRIVDRSGEEDDVVIDGLGNRMPDHLAFNADATRLLTQRANRMPEVWDTRTGLIVGSCGEPGRTCEQYVVSPDGSRIAAVSATAEGRRDIFLHATSDGRLLSTVTIAPKQLWGECLVAFTPGGGRLITSNQDNDLSLFDTSDGGFVGALRGHAAVVTALAIDPNGRRIATGAANGDIRVWNGDSLDLEKLFIGHAASISTLRFRDGHTLASGSTDGTVRIWAIDEPTRMATLADTRGMTSVVFNPDGSRLAVAPKRGGGVEIWNPWTARRLSRLIDSSAVVTQLAYSPDGSLLAAACLASDTKGPHGSVLVWKTMTGDLTATFKNESGGLAGVCFSADGSRVLATSRDGEVVAWNVRSGRREMSEPFSVRSSKPTTCAVFGLDGSRVACGRAELLDGEGNVAVKLERQGLVSCLATSPDGRTLATGLAIGDVILTDFATGERRTRFIGHRNVVRAIAFDQDGGRLVVGSQDGTLRVWDARRRGHVSDEMLVLPGHEGAVDRVTFTPDGTRIVSGSMDGTIRIWDTTHGHELLVLPGQRDEPKAFAISPDGMHVVSAGRDGIPVISGLSNRRVFEARSAMSERRGGLDVDVGDRGNARRQPGLPRLLQTAEESGEIGEILPVQAERLQER